MDELTGYLTLSTGDVFEGKWLYKNEYIEGEMVFNTAMTGYQEVMTDPSYAGQIVTMTYPLIGNYGCNNQDNESWNPSLSGFVIASPFSNPSHEKDRHSLWEMVQKHHIPTLYDMDTRALTRVIRKHGEVYGKFTTNPDDFPVLKKVDSDIVRKVAVQKPFTIKSKSNTSTSKRIAVIDFGYKHSIVDTLQDLGCEIHIVRFDITWEQMKKINPEAVVLSNGPGNPKDLAYLFDNLKPIIDYYPTLGICLGQQLIALASGAQTKRLPFGHRGSNHPVKDLTTNKVHITSQNHGYVVDEESLNQKEWRVTHQNVNDHSLEGMVHRYKPIMAVQFHPEAHPGPSDSFYIFEQFMALTQTKGEKQHA
ncbi:carbamoyl-phosphate synthase small subunit [Salinibacillus kushneri]|uniref:Carbamoyl phosphate synthase small chain n=1 Tax=Salinibacillus kushneri TaxID=237682 RepID=A0A1I0G9N9_9BACI|nr:carbamoyl phosphate synthase small subunit [Salinibacillus kushneri]SET66639.1 carbamoyl-phosphate synthase small subunit [Salinibacillus kushneri]